MAERVGHPLSGCFPGVRRFSDRDPVPQGTVRTGLCRPAVQGCGTGKAEQGVFADFKLDEIDVDGARLRVSTLVALPAALPRRKADNSGRLIADQLSSRAATDNLGLTE